MPIPPRITTLGGATPAADTPGEAQSRRQIDVITDVVLGFVAQTIAESDIRPYLPIVLNIESEIGGGHGWQWRALRDGKLPRGCAGEGLRMPAAGAVRVAHCAA